MKAFCIFLIFIPFLSFSQQYRVKSYTQENGLQNELVKSIAVDDIGFLWIGTERGLIRYNGEEFIEYNDKLDSKHVKSVFCKNNGQLFVIDEMGFTKIDYGIKKAEFHTILHGAIKSTDSLLWYPKLMFEDSKGVLWFSDNNTVYKFNNNKITRYNLGNLNVPDNYYRSFSFFEDGFGHFFAVSQTGYFYQYDEVGDNFVPVNTAFSIGNVSCILKVKTGKIIVGCNNHIGEISIGKDGTIKNFSTLDNNIDASALLLNEDSTFFVGSWTRGLFHAKIINNKYKFEIVGNLPIIGGINQIIRNGLDIFLATDNGIILLNKNIFHSDFDNLTNRYIQDIAKDGKNIYFTDGYSIFSIDDNSLKPRVLYNSKNSLILSILPDNGNIWFSDNQGFLRRLRNGAITKTIDLRRYGEAVYNFTKDNNGNIWVCQENLKGVLKITPDFKFIVYGESSGIKSRVNFIKNSPLTYIFLGASADNDYLYYFNPEQEKFINLSKTLPFEHNRSIIINDLVFDQNEILWMASNEGLLRVRGNDIRRVNIEHLTEEDIKAVTVDLNGNIWFASSHGVSKFDGKNTVTFDHIEGLLSKTISYRCLLCDSKNRMWAGTLSGISYSDNNIKPLLTPVPVFLNITEKGIPLENYENNSFDNLTYLSFEFVSPEFPTEGTRYNVKIVGKDKNWRLLTGKNEVIYTDFDKNNYELLIKAKQRGNYLWSEPLSYSFNVYTIWYQTWWAWTIFGVFLFIVVYSYTKWRSRRLEHESQSLNKLVKKRTYELEKTTTEIEAKNKQLIIARDIAEKSSHAKAEFLSTMSHEIRTPMNAVMGMINILLMEDPRPEQLDRINTLKFSAENLLTLINDILDFNKIDAGKVEFEKIEFDLKKVVNNIRLGFEPSANEKNIKLNLHLDEKIPDILIGDPTRISQILTNLVGNAIKFTKKGEVNIILNKRLKPGNAVEIFFRIKDTGIGISPKKLDNIFESFSQASTNTTRRYGGTGLGLSITKRLLEMMGSRIRVQSRVGIGSEFSFKYTFKIGEKKVGGKEDAKKIKPLSSLKGYKILLVEDNKINIKIAKQILEKWDLEVDVAEDGKIAIEKFAVGKYHLILMDLHLPEIDGYDATIEIRKKDKEVPIIALTAAALIQEKEKVFAVGMNDFISKPFKPNDLHKKISDNISSYLKIDLQV